MKNVYTTIRIKKSLLTKLRKMKKGPETYESLIMRSMINKPKRGRPTIQ